MARDILVAIVVMRVCILPLLFWSALVSPVMAQRQLPARVDAVALGPYSEIGSGAVVESPLGSYRRTGLSHDDRMAWFFNTTAVGDFVKLTVTFPDDSPRVCEIFQIADSTAYWPADTMGAGYITGFTFSQTSTMLTQSFYFYVSSAPQFGLVFKSSAPNFPCAVQSLSVEKLDASSGFPPPPDEAQQPGRRKMGLFVEDPSFSVTYGDHPIDDDAHLDRFLNPMDRNVWYMKRMMQNLMIYPVVWYTQSLYRPSDEFPPGMTTNRAHPSDYDQRMAARYSTEGIDFWPSIRNWSLPSIASFMHTSSDVMSGSASEYVNAVAVDPVKLTATVRTTSAWHLPPEMNALHPRVRTAIKNVVSEIAGRLAMYPSFRGIVLWTGLDSTHSLGLAQQSFDDYSVNLFAMENGYDLPQYTGPGRFGQWYAWLRDNHWDEWIAWRKDKQTAFYNELADIVTAQRGDALLQVMVQYPIPTEGYDYDQGNHVTDVGKYLSDAGIDLDALAQNPAIVISRWYDSMAYEAYLRSSPPTSASMMTRLAGRGLDFDPAWQAPFLDKTSGAVMQRTYFEDNVAGKPLLARPSYWKSGSEVTSQVTSPMGAGRQALEYPAKSLALYDAMFLAHGGFQKGGTGSEDWLQPWSATYTSLPAVRFDTVSSDDSVIVRSKDAEGAHWIYVVNASGVEKTVDVNMPADGNLQSLGLVTDSMAVQAGQTVRVTLPAYDLRAWKLLGNGE